MKIAIFTNNYLPNPYGVSTSIETFRREFEARGHTVYIFAPEWKGYKDENPNVFRYPAWDLKIKIRYPLGIPFSTKLDKVIKNLDIDVIHSQHPNLLGDAAIRWARKKKVPLVFTWHTLYDRYVNFVPFVPNKLASWFIIKQAVRYANKASAVVVPTDSVIPVLKKWGVTSRDIYPVATGVSEEEFVSPEPEKIREEYQVGRDEKIILLVSRLTIEKNVEFIFHSLKNFLKKGKVKFLVVGGGYLLSKLQDLCRRENIADKVLFCGVIDHKKIKNYFAAADIFVYSSLSETQGMIVSEAMYMGLPIVAVSATGIKSLVINNGNGLLVSENQSEFSSAVQKLIDNEDLRQKFGEVSKRIADTKFTASVCAEEMLGVYKKAIEKKRP